MEGENLEREKWGKLNESVLARDHKIGSIQLKFSNDRKNWLIRCLIWFSESLSKHMSFIKFN